MMNSFEELIHPITLKEFFTKYWEKEHLVIRGSCTRCTEWMKSLYTWDMFNGYLNQYPDIKGLQVLNYDGQDGRWCLDKTVKEKKRIFDKESIYNMWNSGKSFVIPI